MRGVGCSTARGATASSISEHPRRLRPRSCRGGSLELPERTILDGCSPCHGEDEDGPIVARHRIAGLREHRRRARGDSNIVSGLMRLRALEQSISRRNERTANFVASASTLLKESPTGPSKASITISQKFTISESFWALSVWTSNSTSVDEQPSPSNSLVSSSSLNSRKVTAFAHRAHLRPESREQHGRRCR
jgi:hypothetical protein